MSVLAMGCSKGTCVLQTVWQTHSMNLSFLRAFCTVCVPNNAGKHSDELSIKCICFSERTWMWRLSYSPLSYSYSHAMSGTACHSQPTSQTVPGSSPSSDIYSTSRGTRTGTKTWPFTGSNMVTSSASSLAPITRSFSMVWIGSRRLSLIKLTTSVRGPTTRCSSRCSSGKMVGSL